MPVHDIKSIREYYKKLKDQRLVRTWEEFSKKVGYGESYIPRVINNHVPLTDEVLKKINDAKFDEMKETNNENERNKLSSNNMTENKEAQPPEITTPSVVPGVEVGLKDQLLKSKDDLIKSKNDLIEVLNRENALLTEMKNTGQRLGELTGKIEAIRSILERSQPYQDSLQAEDSHPVLVPKDSKKDKTAG